MPPLDEAAVLKPPADGDHVTLIQSPVETNGGKGDVVLLSSPASSCPGSQQQQLLIDPAITNSNNGWRVLPSVKAQRTSNPVRNIVDNLRPPRHLGADKPTISLALGDPTSYGNLPCPSVLTDAIAESLASHKHNGYVPSVGSVEARRALAAAYSLDNAPLTEEDVVICSGGSGALEIAITALLNEGDNLLVPRPGFALYQVITQSLGGEVRHYDLVPERSWEVDVAHLESLIDDRTKAILLNNPSNPCGNVLPMANLQAVLAVASRHRLPVISDEIYAKMAFTGHAFHPLASLTSDVPVLTVGGLAKQFAVPGWRVGWVLLYDRHAILSTGEPMSVRQGIRNLTQVIVGSNTLVQSAIPSLFPPPSSPLADRLDGFYRHYVGTLERNAEYVVQRVRRMAGLDVVVPQGAMYAMIRLQPGAFVMGGEDGEGGAEDDDVAFSQALLQEENLVVLPGQCFGIRGFVRVVFAPPEDVLSQAMDRLEAFTARHYRHDTTTSTMAADPPQKDVRLL